MTIPLQKFPIITSATQLFDFYKIPWRRIYSSYEELPPTWDGKYLTIDWKEEYDSTPENVGWSFHEVSHYIFAPENSRGIPNYGLGTDLRGGKSKADASYIRGLYIDDDEGACAALDIYFMSLHRQKKDDIEAHMSNSGIEFYQKNYIKLMQSAGFNTSFVKAHLNRFIYEIL